MFLQKLPTELLLDIIETLNIEDHVNLSAINRHFNAMLTPGLRKRAVEMCTDLEHILALGLRVGKQYRSKSPTARAIANHRISSLKTLLSCGHFGSKSLNILMGLAIARMGQSEVCNTAVMKLLFDHGADPNWRHDSGHTWLHKAAYSGWRVSPEVMVAWISTLIECGADINDATDAGQTPLHFRIYFGNIEAMKILVKYGADVNAKNLHGITPLHLGLNRNFKYQQILRNSGASVHV